MKTFNFPNKLKVVSNSKLSFIRILKLIFLVKEKDVETKTIVYFDKIEYATAQ